MYINYNEMLVSDLPHVLFQNNCQVQEPIVKVNHPDDKKKLT